jgi:NADPH-dependent 2,4-dienoyl-CoA reductase/sulfur reductase-like enzyme
LVTKGIKIDKMVEGLDDRTDDYPKLSRSFESMKAEYDVVVVGSGYGAGVAASRMARAGNSVAILELGREVRRMNLLNVVDLKSPCPWGLPN